MDGSRRVSSNGRYIDHALAEFDEGASIGTYGWFSHGIPCVGHRHIEQDEPLDRYVQF